MKMNGLAGYVLDKLLLPSIIITTVYLSFSRLADYPLDIVNIIRGIIVPLIILTFLILSKPARISKLTFKSSIGIFFSFAGFYIFQRGAESPSMIILILGMASTLFYLGISTWSYLELGRNLSIVPALREVVSRGPYQHVRHPIYACYLHLALSYLIILPSLINLTAAFIIVAGLSLRVDEEEKLLASDLTYNTYRNKIKNKLFSFLFSFPLMILFVFAALTYFRPHTKILAGNSSLLVQFAQPATSLDPRIYDDWSSVFIGNHIYRRLVPDNSRSEIIAISNEMRLKCKDSDDLNSYCPILRLTFSITPFLDCEGRTYTIEEIRSEFFQILAKKSWVLPKMVKCKSPTSDICVDLPNAPDIKRRLRNLYLRFGWSKAKSDDKKIGSGPYCLLNLKKKGSEIQTGDLVAISSPNLNTHIHFRTSLSANDTFNIALYGTSDLLVGRRRNVMTHTPLGYYVVTNPKLHKRNIPWNTDSAKAIIKSHFQKFDIIYPGENAISDVLPTGAAHSSEAVKIEKLSRPLSLALPDYISHCQQLADQLIGHWQGLRLNHRAECLNTSYFVESLMKDKSKVWDGFLTPLSPGAPGRNAIEFQYFSPDSREAWTGSFNNTARFYYLVGIGQSFVTVDNSKICGLKPNSMGHSDIFVTDFIRCEN